MVRREVITEAIMDKNIGGKGGGMKGTWTNNVDRTLYIGCGGKGTEATGGWNGGGRGITSGQAYSGGGGGGSHVAIKSGLLRSLSKDDLIIVAGGGGGAGSGTGNAVVYGNGGAGGGNTRIYCGIYVIQWYNSMCGQRRRCYTWDW